MQVVRRLLTAALVLAALLLLNNVVYGQGAGEVQHTVQVGENLYRISLKYGTTVTAIAQANNITNPNLVYVGQVLRIPAVVQGTPAPVPTATPNVAGTPATATITPVVTVTPAAPTAAPAPTETTYVVQPGDNLFRIALRYNLTTAALAAYNGICCPNLIYVGQTLRIPPGAVAAPAPGVTPKGPTAAAPAPGTPPPNEAGNVGFAMGIQLHLPNQDMGGVMQRAQELNMAWAKQQIEWSAYEPTAGAVNWTPIDQMIEAMEAADVNILVSVASAPDWARDSSQEKGPPSDYQTFANFVGAMAERYEGRIQAYEIWNEQNLRREWNTPRGISAASYVEMLRLAYTAIKTADPAAIVVTGGLAPTGFNDGVNAIDDRVYLRQMYAAGVRDWADAIGSHPNGWANPPDSVCCRNNRPAVSGWDDHPSFFFRQTLQDYREIMVQNGDSGTYIWPTEFGWGSNDGLNVDPPAELAFVAFTSLDEQSQYLIRGFQLGRELGYVGPMFLWNLNFCPVVGVTGEQCLWSLLDPAGNPRPAFLALRDAND